jgi:hypothetical protein
MLRGREALDALAVAARAAAVTTRRTHPKDAPATRLQGPKGYVLAGPSARAANFHNKVASLKKRKTCSCRPETGCCPACRIVCVPFIRHWKTGKIIRPKKSRFFCFCVAR